MLIRSSHISTGSPLRAPSVPASSRAAPALSSSVAFGRERQPDQESGRGMLGDQFEESGEGEPLAAPADQGLQRRGDRLGLVAQREPDPDFAPVHSEKTAGGWKQTPLYCAIVAKNSLLFFVRFIRSSRNSSASTGGMSARKLRSR